LSRFVLTCSTLFAFGVGLLGTCITQPSYAEGHQGYFVGVGLGYAQAHETMGANEAREGGAFRLEPGHRYRSYDLELESRLRFGFDRSLDSGASVLNILSYGADARLRFPVRRNARSVVRLGPLVELHTQKAYLDAFSSTERFKLGVASVGASVQLVHGLSLCRELAFDVEVPLVARVSRPSREPVVASVSKYQALRLRGILRSKHPGWQWEPFFLFEASSTLVPRWAGSLRAFAGIQVVKNP
jgi:hypothetical protein